MKFALLSPSPIVILALLASGCGSKSSAANPTPTAAHPKAAPTAVPAPLGSFASYADPLLKTAISEGNGLLPQMEHGDLTILGDQCSLVGGDLSNSKSAFSSSPVPYSGRTTYKMAYDGYKLILSATDECGIAADEGSRKAMKPAISDMKSGLSKLGSAESAMARWQAGKV